MSDVGDYNYDKDEGQGVEYDEYVMDEPSKKGSIKKGLGVGALATVIFELFVGLVLDAQHNLVDRYIAYMLGIVVLFIVSVYAKSTWKMIFFGTPMVIILSFALPYGAPNIFGGLLSPFVNTIPTLVGVLDSVQKLGSDTRDIETTVGYVETYGFLVDFIFAMFVGTFAGIGLVGFVKIFANKTSILTIITFFFSTLFFIIGVVILPYVLVVSSGVTQFGLAMSAGTLNLAYGFDVSSQNGTDAAQPFFAEAEKWFQEAEDLLKGLEDMQAFNLLGTALPNYKILIDNLLAFINTAVNMAQSVVPMFLGLGAVTVGISQSMAVIQSATQNLNLNALSDQDRAEFEAGILKMREGFEYIISALPEIEEALKSFSSVDTEGVKNSDAGDLDTQVDTVDGTVRLVNVTLVVFEVLITQYNETTEEPFVHLLRSALAMNELSTNVGGDSSYEGTTPLLNDIIGNVTIVIEALTDPSFIEFVATDVLGVSSVENLKSSIGGIFEFLRDTSYIAINMGYFGLIANPALNDMNSTMTQVSKGGGEDFTNISQVEYDERLVEFNDTSTGITVQAVDMQQAAIWLRGNITIMGDKSVDPERPYGLMQDAGKEFSSLFDEFHFIEDSNNFYYMSLALENTVRSLKRIALIDSQVDLIQTEYDLLETYAWPGDTALIWTSVTNINDTINEIQVSLDILEFALDNAAGNFSLTTMKNTAASSFAISNTDTASSTDSIGENVANIQGFKDDILAVTSTLPTNDSEFTAAKTAIQTSLSNIFTEIGFVNNNSKQINITA